MSNATTQSTIADAKKVLERLRAAGHDVIDQGVILCFALVMLKIDTLTDDDFTTLIEKTLRKAIKDMKK